MTGNAFKAADALSSAAVSLVMGEQMVLAPMTSPKGYSKLPEANGSRPSVEFRGTYAGSFGVQKAGGDRAGTDISGFVQSKSRMISADETDWPSQARVGDYIRLIEQPGQPTVSIERIAHDGVNRVNVKVVGVDAL